jgi:hypothetical protein
LFVDLKSDMMPLSKSMHPIVEGDVGRGRAQ